MRDVDIREALASRLAERYARHDGCLRIWHEMPVALGASRVDVGLVNGHLSGFEIKSDRDTLARLPSQVKHYSSCLDYATIVVSGRRSPSICDHVPEWWGIWEARPRKDAGALPRLVQRRRSAMNPAIEPFAVAQLLLRDEGAQVLRAHGHGARLSRATRWDIWDRLVEVLPLPILRAEVRRLLTTRPKCSTD